MSRTLAAALLAMPGITVLVGERVALGQLPEGTPLPALVYSVISIEPTDYLEGAAYETMRLQINPLAATIGEVQQIHDAVQAALDGMAQVDLVGRRVIDVRRDTVGPEDYHTNDAGDVTWTWPRDYIIRYE